MGLHVRVICQVATQENRSSKRQHTEWNLEDFQGSHKPHQSSQSNAYQSYGQVEDMESSQFLRVLQALLNHRVPRELDELQGLYARATDRILNQVSDLTGLDL